MSSPKLQQITSVPSVTSFTKGSVLGNNIPAINGQISNLRSCDTPIPPNLSIPSHAASLKLDDSNQTSQASSFAAALRSLAKNATNSKILTSTEPNNDGPTTVSTSKIYENSSPVMSSAERGSKRDKINMSPSNLNTVLGANDIMPINPGVSASLLDVRKVRSFNI